ncbi:GMC family oxidoreductase N-terminal domain-containing protein [Specibacter cremeus]|uniref:GMC family oxidoreductase N-terminal domain-containing protein n=1 Tax=Specibacter cremeus TaxID=1629051 RepID=UPI0013DD906F|nr:GMC family oxidoreductase N-terminal domain-containing protein [Specibacter cremeus]
MNTTAPLPATVDTLVIGGGTGGAAFAGVLAAHTDQTILLVEAGPDYGKKSGGQWPADMLDARAIPLSHDYDLHTPRSAGEGVLDLPRARILGGCSSHNGCTASIGARHDYDDWAARGNPSWTADRVAPLLEWVRDRFRVNRYTEAELTPPQRAFVEAGMATGLPFADDLDDLAAAEGIGPMPVNIVDGVRWNSAFAFLDAVRERPNMTIEGNVTVDRIDIADGRARGAFVTQGDGTTSYIAAQRVVLAAGAYHSPALLLRSGVGSADELRALGIEVERDLPGVGKHLLDHSCIQLDFAGRPGLLEELAALELHPDEQALGRARSSVCDDGPYDIHVFMVAGANSGHPGLPPISLYGGAMRAKSEGTVTLGPGLDVVNPVIDHRYGTDPENHDRTVLQEARDLLERMVAREELAPILGERVITGPADPLEDIVNYCHPAGTCKLGPASDPLAVVADNGQVHGVRGLFVADASIMPAITRGNINLPTAMIGANIAALMAGAAPVEVVDANLAAPARVLAAPPRGLSANTSFEQDIAEQPRALARLADSGDYRALRAIAGRPWQRIVFTGMGSSHFSALPTWRALAATGRPTWWVDSGQLLDSIELLTPDTLLVATSQSGASGEIVELLEMVRSGSASVGALVGVADDESSPLARASDVFLPLFSGPEATVSTKSYLNTLGVHRQIAAAFMGKDAAPVNDEIRAVAAIVETAIGETRLGRLAERIIAAPGRRIAAVGKRDDAATALLAGLITKEASKVAIEGFIGGQFRHGPFELAGPGLTAFLYGADSSSDDETLPRLATDLLDTGSTVVLIGDVELDGAITIPAAGATTLERLATNAVVAELAAVELARANGVVPGDFAFGSKVTTIL